MSGPLASWVSKHATVDPAVLAKARKRGDETSEKVIIDVVRELALCSRPDGTSVYAPTWEELAQRTRTSRSTVGAALKLAVETGLLRVKQAGRGRSNATVYDVVNVTLCEPPAGCPAACKGLATTLAEKVQEPDLSRAEARPRKGPGQGRKGPGAGVKGPAPGPTTDTGDGSPSGRAVTHPESSAALAPNGAALEPGQQEQEPASDGEPARVKREDWWPAVNPGRPMPERSTEEERAAEEERKRALALRLLDDGGSDLPESRQQTGPSLNERSSA